MLLTCPQCSKANLIEGAVASLPCYFCGVTLVRPLGHRFDPQAKRDCAGCGKPIEGLPEWLMEGGWWQPFHHPCASAALEADREAREARGATNARKAGQNASPPSLSPDHPLWRR